MPFMCLKIFVRVGNRQALVVVNTKMWVAVQLAIVLVLFLKSSHWLSLTIIVTLVVLIYFSDLI